MIETHELKNIPLRVLAVDDQPNALKTIKNLLESYGCEVEGAGDPTDASQSPDDPGSMPL